MAVLSSNKISGNRPLFSAPSLKGHLSQVVSKEPPDLPTGDLKRGLPSLLRCVWDEGRSWNHTRKHRPSTPISWGLSLTPTLLCLTEFLENVTHCSKCRTWLQHEPLSVHNAGNYLPLSPTGYKNTEAGGYPEGQGQQLCTSNSNPRPLKAPLPPSSSVRQRNGRGQAFPSEGRPLTHTGNKGIKKKNLEGSETKSTSIRNFLKLTKFPKSLFWIMNLIRTAKRPAGQDPRKLNGGTSEMQLSWGVAPAGGGGGLFGEAPASESPMFL